MARNADTTDSYIEMVLSLKGRVRPVDLHMVPEPIRSDVLRAYFDAHGAQAELYLDGDDLVAGTEPDGVPATPAPVQTPAPAPAPASPAAPPADLTETGESAIDLLLGDYDGVPSAVAENAPAEGGLGEDGQATAGYSAAAMAGTAVPTRDPASAAQGRTPAEPDAPKPDGSSIWLIWWIPTVLVPTLGGIAAWFFLRRRRQTAARAMLTVGLVIGILASVIFLRYAEQIATVAARTAVPDVIVLPSKPAPTSVVPTTPSAAKDASGSSATKE